MRKLLLLGGIALLAACQSAPDTPEPIMADEPKGFSFIVIGDTPYDAKDQAVLDEAVPLVRDANYPFVIHVGDYKGGGAPCESKQDAAHEDLIANLSPIKVFYTPGDNETVDCDRKKTGDPATRPSEKERLNTIRKLFFSGQQPTAYQSVSQAGFPENQRWQYEGVQFATLHVVATNNGRSEILNPVDLEWAKTAVSARDAANLDWLAQTFATAKASGSPAVVLAMQADMTDLHVSKTDPKKSQVPNMPCGDEVSKKYLVCDAFTELRGTIRDAANNFDGPVILIHGDSSPFTLNQEFAGAEAENLWRLNAAGDAGEKGPHKWGTRDITVVTIDTESSTPISARGFLTNKVPKSK